VRGQARQHAGEQPLFLGGDFVGHGGEATRLAWARPRSMDEKQTRPATWPASSV
jgi:hypothetical protein